MKLCEMKNRAEHDPFEPHYTTHEIAEMWKLDDTTVRRIFQDEPGVFKIGKLGRRDGKRDYITLRIPASVANRVYRQRTAQRYNQGMLSLYRRHTGKCTYRDKGQNYMKCSCPIWCDGELNGRRFRKSVGLRDWSRAVKRVERWEEKPGEAIAIPSLQDCIESYLGDCRARNLKTSTVASYKKTLEHFEAFCGTMHVDQTDLGLLTDFRASRHVKASTSGKELETLWAFCAFAKKRGWIAENYARELDPPREEGLPTLPFGGDEVETILGACGKLEDDNPNTRERTRNRARALCLVLLYSGVSAGIKQHQFSRFWCCQDRR